MTFIHYGVQQIFDATIRPTQSLDVIVLILIVSVVFTYILLTLVAFCSQLNKLKDSVSAHWIALCAFLPIIVVWLYGYMSIRQLRVCVIYIYVCNQGSGQRNKKKPAILYQNNHNTHHSLLQSMLLIIFSHQIIIFVLKKFQLIIGWNRDFIIHIAKIFVKSDILCDRTFAIEWTNLKPKKNEIFSFDIFTYNLWWSSASDKYIKKIAK